MARASVSPSSLRCAHTRAANNSPILGTPKRILGPLDSKHGPLPRPIRHLESIAERPVTKRPQHGKVCLKPARLLHLLLPKRMHRRPRVADFELGSTAANVGGARIGGARLDVGASLEVGEGERLTTVWRGEGLEEDGGLRSCGEGEGDLRREGGRSGGEGFLDGCLE